jgi:aminopeptidase N
VSIQNPQYFWFNESAKISTYLYAFFAGPFDYFENNKEGLPPMRIYARKTLMNEVNHEDMFHCT